MDKAQAGSIFHISGRGLGYITDNRTVSSGRAEKRILAGGFCNAIMEQLQWHGSGVSWERLHVRIIRTKVDWWSFLTPRWDNRLSFEPPVYGMESESRIPLWSDCFGVYELIKDVLKTYTTILATPSYTVAMSSSFTILQGFKTETTDYWREYLVKPLLNI